MHTSTAKTSKAVLIAALLASTAFALPASQNEKRQHVSCNAQGVCGVINSCGNDYTVVAGSDPSTPGTPPSKPINLPAMLPQSSSISSSSARAKATGTVAASSIGGRDDGLVPAPARLKARNLRSRNPNPAAGAAAAEAAALLARDPLNPPTSPNPSTSTRNRLQARQVGAQRWCAIGTSLYLNIVPVQASKVNVDNLKSLLTNAATLIDQVIASVGADAAVSGGFASAVNAGNIPTGGGAPNAIFSIAPQAGGGDQFNIFQGTEGSITWGQAKASVGLLQDWCGKKGWQWVGANVIVSTSQVGQLVLN